MRDLCSPKLKEFSEVSLLNVEYELYYERVEWELEIVFYKKFAFRFSNSNNFTI